MPDPLNYRASHSATYYTPPSRLDVRRTLAGLAGAAALAAIGGFLYAIIQPRLEDMWVRVGAAAVAALATGLLALLPVRYGRVRSPAIASVLGALVALIALYAIWLTWVHNVLHYNRIMLSYRLLLMHPFFLLRCIRRINDIGTWSYRGDVYRGPVLLVLWLGEAAMIIAAGALLPIKGLFSDDPACRDCGSRCKRVPNLPRFAADRQEEFVSAVYDRDFAALATHAAPRNVDAPELSIRLMSCLSCGSTNVVTVSRIAWVTTGTPGRATVKTVPLIDQMLLTPDEAEELKAVCAQVREQREAARAAADEETSEAPESSS